VRVLVVGGYGFFGGQFVRLLADDAGLTFLVAGRSLEKARAFCTGFPAAAAELLPARFDRAGDVDAQLALLAPHIVVDASGPFQGYDGDPYRLPRVAIRHGACYLDLADATSFVSGIQALDAEARERGVFVLSGVSSYPVLTAALARRLGRDLARVDAITAGIAPSPWADVGINVLRAISSYAGKPVVLVHGGKPASGVAFVDTIRFTIAPPGAVPLDNLHFSLVDVPDHAVLPPLWSGLQSIWVGAAPVPAILHRCLNGLAWLVHRGLLPSLQPMAGVFHAVMRKARWGAHRGGMFVTVDGTTADGAPARREWHLVAEGDAGPLIPSMAAAAVIRKVRAGKPPAAGARASTGDLELDDYEPLFAGRSIRTGFRSSSDAAAGAPLYRHILGSAWDDLAPPIRAMHSLPTDGHHHACAAGRAAVERGRNPLARLIATIMRFPQDGRDVPVQVDFSSSPAGEVWRRTFAGRSFQSTQRRGEGRMQGLLAESFGPMTFGLAVVVVNGGIELIVRRWRIFGVPLPRVLAPGGHARESAQDGRFNFDVEIGLPLIGRVVRYRGHLDPQTHTQAIQTTP
jgi:hypothetical protein